MRRLFSVKLATLVVLACGCVTMAGEIPAAGPWRAWLDCPGGELPFGLEIVHRGQSIEAWITNGTERIPVPHVRLEDGEWWFDLEHYDAYVRGRLDEDGTRLDGVWRRRLAREMAELPFHATAGEAPRFPAETSGDPAAPDLAPRWAAQFGLRPDPSVALFETRSDGTIHGTFLNSSGDYRYLAGTFDHGRLRLSRFDGAHTFLVDARLQSDGTLEGMFWEAGYIEDTWTARADDGAQIRDPFAHLALPERVDLGRLVLYDFDGTPCTLAEPRFSGSLLVVEILGTWCPNCHDASRFLNELQREYGERGLSTVGLAFEMSTDFARNVRFVRKYQQRHRVTYPLLLAFTDAQVTPADLFPPERGVFAFPTILFLGPDGSVHTSYTGFSGPATGEEHAKMKARFHELIEGLLAAAGR